MEKDGLDQIIKAAQAGNRDAFAALLEDRYDMMFRMAYKYCGNREDAEDITQNACIKLSRHIGAFRFECSFSSWVYRLVINTGKDMFKYSKPQVALEDGHIGATEQDAEEKVYMGEILEQVYALPEREMAALLLVASEGLTHKEAAAVLECKESTVSWYIHEARKKLGIQEGKGERSHG